jgi:hypothetical protein
MAAANKLYVQGIYKRFGYWGTWLPNMRLALGDIGIQQAGVFKRLTSMRKLKLSFKTRVGKKPVDFTHTSESGITLRAKAAGEVVAGMTLPLDQAGIQVEFSRQGAFLFQAIGCFIDEIENRNELGQSIIKLQRNGTWQPDWAVVDGLVRADTVTIVVSNSKRASLELTTKTPPQIGNIANVDIGLRVRVQRGDMERFLAAKGLSPLFTLTRIRKSLVDKLMGRPGQIYFGGEVQGEEADWDVLEAVEPEFPPAMDDGSIII